MEVELKEKKPKDIFAIFIFEIIGTLFLVCAIEMVVQKGGNTVAIAFALFLGIQVSGAITGGHFNPAVTLAVLIAGSHYKKIGYAFLLIVAQIIGAFAGAIVANLVTGGYLTVGPASLITD
jgi:glycerol uptake facilitator-like aquaporin